MTNATLNGTYVTLTEATFRIETLNGGLAIHGAWRSAAAAERFRGTMTGAPRYRVVAVEPYLYATPGGRVAETDVIVPMQ